MAQLVVRNIDEAVVRALKLRAAARGVSAEAEHREILREALLSKKRKGASFKSALAAMPDVGHDDDFAFERDLIGSMAYLVDTNVLSELRKGKRCQPSVADWLATVDDDALFLSVLVIGELQRGADRIRRRDAVSADALDRWLGNLTTKYEERILPITLPIARLWGSFGVPDPIPTVDGLLAATAVHHDLVLVTRNVKDIARTGVQHINPFG